LLGVTSERGYPIRCFGNSREIRYHNLKSSAEVQASFDTDRDPMLVKIAGDKFHFQTISRTGEIVGSCVLDRPQQ